jgi:hemerythrin-like domain-containing protein
MSEDGDCVKDFMFEHSILDRILLIFEVIIKNHNNKIIDYKYLKVLILIIKIFIENHHEKMEELHVFPKITSNNNKELVKILIEEHKTSRILTGKILKYCENNLIYNKNIELVKNLLQKFIDMYRYHESHENLEIYPEFEKNITKKEYKKINSLVEENEKLILGKIKIKNIIQIIIKIEKINY